MCKNLEAQVGSLMQDARQAAGTMESIHHDLQSSAFGDPETSAIEASIVTDSARRRHMRLTDMIQQIAECCERVCPHKADTCETRAQWGKEIRELEKRFCRLLH